MDEQTLTENNEHPHNQPRDFASQLDHGTAQIVYDELGHQIEMMDEVLDEYETHNLEHVKSYEQLQSRSARFRKMRGMLQTATDTDL